MLFFTLISLTWTAASALAVPHSKRSCDISRAAINFPAGQTAIAAPAEKPSYIGVAIGTQNYTCGSAGTYTNNVALAEVFDVSCLYNTPVWSSIPDTAYAVWKAAPPTLPASAVISLLHNINTPVVLGQHYYTTNPITGTGVSPKWDFTSSGATTGNKDAYVVAAKASGLSAPTGSKDIDWVLLNSIQGKLASQVYRVDTRGGQPPATCTPGSSPIAVKYVALYWLFGSSL